LGLKVAFLPHVNDELFLSCFKNERNRPPFNIIVKSSRNLRSAQHVGSILAAERKFLFAKKTIQGLRAIGDTIDLALASKKWKRER
jgi:hypothetical protein